jgi:hypothetical protein
VPVNMALKEFAERVSCSPSFIHRAPFAGVNQNQPLVRADCGGARVRAQCDDRDGGMRCGTVPRVSAGGLVLGGHGWVWKWTFKRSGAVPPPRAVGAAVPSRRPVPAVSRWC